MSYTSEISAGDLRKILEQLDKDVKSLADIAEEEKDFARANGFDSAVEFIFFEINYGAKTDNGVKLPDDAIFDYETSKYLSEENLSECRDKCLSVSSSSTYEAWFRQGMIRGYLEIRRRIKRHANGVPAEDGTAIVDIVFWGAGTWR